MGEIIIKVSGDVKEELVLGDAEILKENIEKFPKIKHSMEIEETSEDELYLQGD